MVQSIGLAVVYVIVARLGLSYAYVSPSATAFWPPTGIALAAIMMLGFRYWPAIFCGAFFVNVMISGLVPSSFAIATGNTLEALAGAWLTLRYGGETSIARPRKFYAFLLGGALFATMISAGVGATSLVMTGAAPVEAFREILITWWLGDAAGALIFAPPILLFSDLCGSLTRRGLEFALILLAMVIFSVATFTDATVIGRSHAPLSFLCIPLIAWAACRFGAGGASVTTLIVGLILVAGTLQMAGPFGDMPGNEALLFVQAFTAVMSGMGILLGGAVGACNEVSERLEKANVDLEARIAERTAELAAAERLARRINKRLTEAQHLAKVGSWEWNMEKDVLLWSEELYRIYGRDPKTFFPSYETFLAHIHPDDRERVMKEVQTSLETGRPFSFRERIIRPDGEERILSSNGEIVDNRLIGTCQDITDQVRMEEALARHAEDLAVYHDIVTHDLSNFSTALLGLLDRLLDEPDGALTVRQQDILRRANRQCHEMNRLAQNAKTLAHLRDGALPTEGRAVRISELCKEVSETVKMVHFDRDVSIDIDCPEDLATSDVPFIENVLHNLVDNAVRHTAKNQPATIKIIGRGDTADGLTVTIQGGTPEADVMNRLFTKYVRGRESAGSGLGLALVRGVVERLGGEVKAGLSQGIFEVSVLLPAVKQ